MNDFEKKTIDSGADEPADNGKEQEQSAQQLAQELEEIREMFQEAIDNADAQQESGEIIQELEDVEDEAQDEEVDSVKRPVCDCCGERPASDAYGEDYLYCDECRELMKRYPFRIGGIVAIVAMVAVFVLSVYFGGDNFEKSISILEAQELYGQSKMISTLNSLYSYISAEDQDSAKISKLIIDSFCRAGYINDAKEYIEQLYSTQELEKLSNKKYKEIVDKTEIFIATQQATEEIVYSAFRGSEFDYDELAASLDEIKESYIDEEKQIKYESALTDYYKAELMELSGKSYEQQLEVLKGIEANDKDGFYEWMYLASLCRVASRMGDKELAEGYFERMVELNSEDMNAYKVYATYFRFLETPDASGMMQIAQQAADNAQSNDLSYYPITVVAYLLKGEGALAFDTMKEYMAASRYTVSDCNLYALCAAYCGDTETYETMKSTLEGAGYELSPLVEKYKNKEMTLAQVLADKGGNLG